MNKKKHFITNLVSAVLSVSVMLFSSCSLISNKTDPVFEITNVTSDLSKVTITIKHPESKYRYIYGVYASTTEDYNRENARLVACIGSDGRTDSREVSFNVPNNGINYIWMKRNPDQAIVKAVPVNITLIDPATNINAEYTSEGIHVTWTNPDAELGNTITVYINYSSSDPYSSAWEKGAVIENPTKDTNSCTFARTVITSDFTCYIRVVVTDKYGSGISSKVAGPFSIK